MQRAPDHDAIIIGAGVCGIYQLYRLVELGLDTRVIEAGSGPGGTWYWNRYPGCRFDSESYTYGYSFSPELLEEWDWSEHFASQPETLRYLNHVVDRFELRSHMQFDSRVTRCSWDEQHHLWDVEIDGGSTLSCRFLLTAVGLLSAPTMPRYPGISAFEGNSFHTYYWPKQGVELTGQRVGVIGTGASGVQVISAIADKVAELTVFQRRPNWCAPLNNGPISRAEMTEIRSRYDEIFERCRATPGGFLHGPVRERMAEVPREQRHALWEDLYTSPGFGVWFANYFDVLVDEQANAEYSAFIADKIRERVDDPAVAEKLIPTDHGFGSRRVPLETKYYEVYNRDNVELIDITDTPIEKITPTGVRTSDRHINLDIIVYATGFDAVTGAFDRMKIVGIDGATLRDKWEATPVTYLGLQSCGFPNLLMLSGPTGGSLSGNIPRGIETFVDFTTGLITHMADSGATRVEPTEEAERAWTDHVRDMHDVPLMGRTQSWITGFNSNVEGRDRPRYLVYNGGAPRFRQRMAEVSDAGYEGFILQ